MNDRDPIARHTFNVFATLYDDGQIMFTIGDRSLNRYADLDQKEAIEKMCEALTQHLHNQPSLAPKSPSPVHETHLAYHLPAFRGERPYAHDIGSTVAIP